MRVCRISRPNSAIAVVLRRHCAGILRGKTHNSLECLAERSIGLVANGLRNINQLLIVAL
jgi:hypothetical protein